MLSHNFEYYQPTTTEEAVDTYHSLQKEQRNPVYFAGGTEIITLGRAGEMTPGAVIDMTHIPECHIYESDDEQLKLGAALTLTKLGNVNGYPFLSTVISEIADNTARNKITLGGNLCANIIYREAVLPLLLTDSQVVIATKDGLEEKPINALFDETLQLHNGELLVQINIDSDAIELPYYTEKRRRQWGVGYPLITIAAVQKEGQIRVAFTGLCAFPFRSLDMEKVLNDTTVKMVDRIEAAVQHIPGDVLDDVHGSSRYRMFVLKNLLHDAIKALEGGDENG